MTEPYYTDGTVTLYHGDARTLHPLWTVADVLVTDPPYGRRWRQGPTGRGQHATGRHNPIAGDYDTSVRDAILALWGNNVRLAVVFGNLLEPPPRDTRQVLVYCKPTDAGTKGTYAGFRRDAEAVYLVGPWTSGRNGTSSILRTAASNSGALHGLAARHGHPHAKPVDVLAELLSRCSPGVVADPFCGSGTTLIAARLVGRKAIGVEIDERWCETAARRLSQMVLDAA